MPGHIKPPGAKIYLNKRRLSCAAGRSDDMQYLQLMYTYAPAWGFGGPSRMMFDYARWMAGAGCRTMVIAGDVNHDYTSIRTRTEVIEGIVIRRVRVFWKKLIRKSLNCVSPSMLIMAIKCIAETNQKTVLHVGELRSPVFLYALILRRMFPRKVVLVHSAFGMLHYKASRLRQWYDALFMGAMLRGIDIALAQNEHEVLCYREYYDRYAIKADNIILMPLHSSAPHVGDSSDGETFTGSRARARQLFQVPEDAVVCVFLGRLHREKGIVRAIDAFLEFSASWAGPTLFLVVGHDSGFQEQAQRYIDTKNARQLVRIVNNVYQERFDYYRLSDMFLGFPTIYEETMLAAVEALACGTPVIVSREADMPFVENGDAGFVIDFSIEVAAGKMRQIAADTIGFRARAREVSARHYAERPALSAFQKAIQSSAGEGVRHAQST